jgi:hypothetical protein
VCTAFAVHALVIACGGLYGTTAYAVVRRTREIGIRMALGTRRGTVMWMVLREVCVLAAVLTSASLASFCGKSPGHEDRTHARSDELVMFDFLNRQMDSREARAPSKHHATGEKG